MKKYSKDVKIKVKKRQLKRGLGWSPHGVRVVPLCLVSRHLSSLPTSTCPSFSSPTERREGFTGPASPAEEENSLLHWMLTLPPSQVPSWLIPTGLARAPDPFCLDSPPRNSSRGPALDIQKILIPLICAEWRHGSQTETERSVGNSTGCPPRSGP